MLAHNLFGNAQADAGAGFFGRKEGNEYLFGNVGRNHLAVVVKINHNLLFRIAFGRNTDIGILFVRELLIWV